MTTPAYLPETLALYRRYRSLCERAVAQVTNEQMFETVGGIPLAIAAVMKHIAGNHRSRWRDFLTTDGEKRDRDRDSEFIAETETPASIQARWEEGWGTAFATLEQLTAEDLARTVTIRGRPLSVLAAIQRNVTHLAYHTGQLVQLARHFAGDEWQTLSIAPGQSEEHNAERREKYGDWREREDVQ